MSQSAMVSETGWPTTTSRGGDSANDGSLLQPVTAAARPSTTSNGVNRVVTFMRIPLEKAKQMNRAPVSRSVLRRWRCVRAAPSRYRTRFRIPNQGSILGDGAIAGELSRARYVQHRLSRPRVRVTIKLQKLLVRGQVRLQIRQMPVVIPVRQQHVSERGE